MSDNKRIKLENRNFFDPITLGLSLQNSPLELFRYNDDISIANAGTFIHELTHYLQFYGSVFGYHYLINQWGTTVMLADYMRFLLDSKCLTYPLVFNKTNIYDFHAKKQESKEFLTQALLLQRFFNEEIYGITYPFLNQFPIQNNLT